MKSRLRTLGLDFSTQLENRAEFQMRDPSQFPSTADVEALQISNMSFRPKSSEYSSWPSVRHFKATGSLIHPTMLHHVFPDLCECQLSETAWSGDNHWREEPAHWLCVDSLDIIQHAIIINADAWPTAQLGRLSFVIPGPRDPSPDGWLRKSVCRAQSNAHIAPTMPPSHDLSGTCRI